MAGPFDNVEAAGEDPAPYTDPEYVARSGEIGIADSDAVQGAGCSTAPKTSADGRVGRSRL